MKKSRLHLKVSRLYFLIIAALTISFGSYAQFNPTGSTSTIIAGSTYNLTPAGIAPWAGALWSTSTVDFTTPFELSFDANVDILSGGGADGFCVVFGQMTNTVSPSPIAGGSLGYYDAANSNYNNHSVAVEFDTYYNSTNNDLYNSMIGMGVDHTTIDRDAGFFSTTPGAAPVQIDPSSYSIKDGVTRHYKIRWDPATQMMLVFCNCNLRIKSNFNYAGWFSTPTAVTWGFTGSTAASSSNHVLSNISMAAFTPVTASITQCGSAVLSVPTGGGLSYFWTTLATTPSITVNTSGIYTEFSYDPTSCSTRAVYTFSVTINPIPVISGKSAFCIGDVATLSTDISGGTWTSGNVGVATIGGTSGTVTASTAGTSTITYTLPTGCMGIYVISVGLAPAAITGPTSVCVGSTIALTDITPGGTWSSGGTPTATINTSGIVTGVSAGTVTITYTTCSGIATIPITVMPLPGAITGPAIVCSGSVITLSDAVTGGTWSSGNTAIATIGSSSGSVTGISPSAVTITYTAPNGCSVTRVITVAPLPAAISGVKILCSGTTTGLSDALGGGTWTSGNTTIATIGLSSGVVSGVATGTAMITYTSTAGCVATTTVTVNPPPTAITGPSSVCVGATITLSDASFTGTWSSDNTLIAPVSSGGVVTGVAIGTATITYTNCGGSVTKTITVNPLPPAITGTLTICQSAYGQLTDASTGGSWSSSDVLKVVVHPITGMLIGASPGTATITYTLATGCYATVTVSVEPFTLPITGTSSLCVGATTSLTDATVGGAWSSGNTGVATVNSSGVVTGVSAGTAYIYYTKCGTSYMAVTVNPLPAAISGSLSVCVGRTTTLSDAVTGGSWTSGSSLIATVGAGTGVVTGVSPGTAVISYTLPTGCMVTSVITVNLSPSVITGSLSVCKGSTTALSDPSPGGVWSMTPTTIGTIDPVSGVATGLSTGTATVTYDMGGCIATATVTVNPIPALFTGNFTPCLDMGSVTIGETTPGGVWTSGNTSVADVDAYGVVTMHAVGSSIISYTIPSTGCAMAVLFYVNPPMAAISGPSVVCVGSTIALTDPVAFGSWTSSNSSIAAVDVVTGVVTGASTGVATITYTQFWCYTTWTVSVLPAPAPIPGPITICLGSTVTISDATPGGVWTCDPEGSISIDPVTGVVTTKSSGTSTITYSMPCGYITVPVIVMTTPPIACVCSYPSAGPFSELGATGIIPPGTYSGNFYIAHNVDITTGGVSLVNAVVIMGAGVKVTVNSGTKLYLEHAHLYSCKPDMWQGIDLATTIYGGGSGPTGQLEITGNANGTSMIEDAMRAVNISAPQELFTYSPGAPPSQLTLYVHGAAFNRNLSGISIDNYTPPMAWPAVPSGLDASYPFVVSNTVFTCRDFSAYAASGVNWPFAWPSNTGSPGALKLAIPPATPYDPPFNLDIAYTMNVCNNGLLSQTGIQLNNVGFTTGPMGAEQYSGVITGGPSAPFAPDDLNLFDNMNYGIYATNTNLVSRYSQFMHIYGPFGGDGIFSQVINSNQYKLYVYGDALKPTYTNSFWDCVSGVTAFGLYDVTGIYANMCSKHSTANLADPQGQYGYKISAISYYQLQTNFNSIYNISTGIGIVSPPYGSTIGLVGETSVQDNTIASVNPAGAPPTLNEYVQQAVDIRNIFHLTTWSWNGFEDVMRNAITDVYNGIAIHDFNRYNMYINVTDNDVKLVQDPTLAPGSNNQTGVKLDGTTLNYTYNNTVTGVGYGTPIPPSTFGSPYASAPLMEGIHLENTGHLSGSYIECNTVKDINTGFCFAGTNVSVTWVNNSMLRNAYGYVLQSDIGHQGVTGTTTGNQWLPSGFWSGLKYQTYTAGTIDAALSILNVPSGSPTEYPFNNAGDGGSIPYTSGGYGLNPLTSYAIPTCTVAPATWVPEAKKTVDKDKHMAPPIASASGSLMIIPNPNNGTFNVKGNIPEMETAGEVTLEVIDMLGRTLYSGKTPITNGVIDKMVVMGGNAADAVYLVRIRNEQTSKVLRFTLKR